MLGSLALVAAFAPASASGSHCAPMAHLRNLDEGMYRGEHGREREANTLAIANAEGAATAT